MDYLDLLYVDGLSYLITSSKLVSKHVQMGAATRLQNKIDTKQTMKTVLVRKKEWNATTVMSA